MMTSSPALHDRLRPVTRPALAALFPRADVAAYADKENPHPAGGGRDADLDYLRAFTVVLVLIHHSVLAYAAMWPAQPATFRILGAPIIDHQRWIGFDLIATFNDTFFMALMFLLSGLFVWPGLERKGSARFLHDRILRLGVPLVVAAALLMPLAYYPTYAVTPGDHGFPAFARAWLSLGFWPSGPTWFIGLLLVFDFVAARIYRLRRTSAASAGIAWPFAAWRQAPAFVAVLLVASVLTYVPMELAFGAERWLTFGPFSFQVSRLLLYAVFFLAGVQLGAVGTGSGPLARNAGLARAWPVWVAAGIAAYALRLAVLVTIALPAFTANRPLPLDGRLLSDITLVLCCSTISIAFIALFRRFAVAHSRVFDSLAASSYGMYLVHYPIVVWLQYAMLPVGLNPILKGVIVSVGVIALSWGLVVTLRRVGAIARVL